MNKLLSERMLELITVYTTKVTSMEETAQNCIHYNFIISELYTKMNFIKRLESQDRTTQADYHQISKFIDLLEIETNKILQEELLIKQLSEEVNKPFGENSLFSQVETNLQNYQQQNIHIHHTHNESHNQDISNDEIIIEESVDEQNDSSKPVSSEKIVFETSSHEFIEVDISMSDIIKGGTIISDTEINLAIQEIKKNKPTKTTKTVKEKSSKKTNSLKEDLHFDEQTPVDKKNKISKNNKKEQND